MRDAATASTKGKMENRYAVCGGAAVARSGLRATARAIAAGQHLVSAPVGLRGGTLRTAQTTPLNMMVRKSPEVFNHARGVRLSDWAEMPAAQ